MTCLVLAFEVVDEDCSFEAHQFERGTTRCMTTSTMLENKRSLLQPSSAFLNESIAPHVKRLSLVPFALSLPLQQGL
jgi:hypothetical protein